MMCVTFTLLKILFHLGLYSIFTVHMNIWLAFGSLPPVHALSLIYPFTHLQVDGGSAENTECRPDLFKHGQESSGIGMSGQDSYTLLCHDTQPHHQLHQVSTSMPAYLISNDDTQSNPPTSIYILLFSVRVNIYE